MDQWGKVKSNNTTPNELIGFCYGVEETSKVDI